MREAVELEHTLMCQYLYAAMSLKVRPEEFQGETRFQMYEVVRRWKRKLLHVAREEMQHLAWAINILIAAGGSPILSRPSFPCVNRFYRSKADPAGLLLELTRFDFATAEKFVRYETAPVDLPGDVPAPPEYESVSQLYDKAARLFTDDLFVAPEREQYDPVDEAQQGVRLRGRQRIPNTIRSAQEARDLIDEIKVHGEGAVAHTSSTKSDDKSHAAIFRAIRDEYLEWGGPAFEACRPVTKNPRLYRDPGAEAQNEVQGELQRSLLQAFNTGYELLLSWLSQLFTRSGTPELRRAIETLVYLPLMTEVLAPLGDAITEVPLAGGETLAQGETLGPSFEIATGELTQLAPSAAERVIDEKLASIRAHLASAVRAAERSALDAELRARLCTTLKYVSASVQLIADELRSRSVDGWPPTGREVAEEARRTRVESSERAGAGWALDFAPRYLSLSFRGWFQCRLATDPDSSQHKRGASGNTIAVVGEPELDRIVRFGSDGAVKRSHCPPVGVHVHAASIRDVGQSDAHASPVPELVGARVELLDRPMFVGRNHIVSEDGEPIDPFVLAIRSDVGFEVRRDARGSGALENGMSPLQRRASGRYPTSSPRADARSLAENFEVLRQLEQMQGVDETVTSPLGYLERRKRALRHDLRQAAPHSLEFAQLTARLAMLDEWVPGTMPWYRFFFQVSYRHTLSGDASVQKPPTRLNAETPWLIEYTMGLSDSDAMSALVWGELRIPTDDEPIQAIC